MRFQTKPEHRNQPGSNPSPLGSHTFKLWCLEMGKNLLHQLVGEIVLILEYKDRFANFQGMNCLAGASVCVCVLSEQRIVSPVDYISKGQVIGKSMACSIDRRKLKARRDLFLFNRPFLPNLNSRSFRSSLPFPNCSNSTLSPRGETLTPNWSRK